MLDRNKAGLVRFAGEIDGRGGEVIFRQHVGLFPTRGRGGIVDVLKKLLDQLGKARAAARAIFRGD